MFSPLPSNSRTPSATPRRIWLAAAVLSAAFQIAARAETLLAASITNDVSPTFTTVDGLLTITSYANSNATTTANLGQAGNWFGVVNGNATAIDGPESVTLQFATNSGLFRIGHIWTRAKVTISGFASDPGFSDSSGYATSVNYSNGTLSYFYGWDSGTEHSFTFRNPAASAGRTLRLNVHDATVGWQATITRVDYATNRATPAVADLGAVQQTIDNFSASDAWSMQNVGLWSDANRRRIADLLFSTNSGIGLSAWRFNLAAGFDPTVHSGTLWQRWRTENGFLTASNNYDWTRQAGQRWFLSAAKEHGVDQYIAMVYSPPTNFTRNGHVYGTDGVGSSNLKPGCEAAFAQYIGDVLAHFKTNSTISERVAFDYVMPVNEPFWEWNGTSQEGSRHANADIIAQAQALRATLDARGLATEIVLAEAGNLQSLYTTQGGISSKYGATYGNYLSAFNGITNLLSRNLSAHSYFTDDPTNQLVSIRQTLKNQLAANPHWRYWQTEYCILGADGRGRDLTMATALNVSRVMWADLVIANASAWHWWLSLSQADYKDGLLYTDFWQPGDAESLYCSKNFWAFGQWSRFVRPGWKRIALPGYDDVFGLMGAAFVNSNNNTVALVFVNQSGTNQLIAPGLTGLPAGKRIAYWSPWITSALPSDNLSPLPPVAPGSACLIPADAVMTFIGTIVNSNATTAPLIAPIPNQSVRVGEPLRLTINLTGADTPASLLKLNVYSSNGKLLSSSTSGACSTTGAITREWFTNFSGIGLSYLAAAPGFPNSPDTSNTLTSFEAPQNLGGRYGTRIRGFVVAPQTGDYTFWIASRHGSELYLGADDNPATRRRIARVSTPTNPREWTNEPIQQSAPVPLVAGRRYYIEAIHFATSGSDNLAVGWQLPDLTLERPIPGSRLSPWTDPSASSEQRSVTLQFTTNQIGTVPVLVVATDPLGKSATNQFTVTVIPALDPNPTNITAQFNDGNLIVSWPPDHIGWELAAQTNPLTSGLSSNWSPLSGSTETNIWMTAIDPKNPAVFYRLSRPQ